MITWMQKHKKYLVVTIWVSTIAFVGAGFVGWGSVDFNLARANNVAKVGQLGVSKKEFDRAFSNAFYQQNTLADGALTQEQALNMGLDKHALYQLMQQKLLLNYAVDLGIKISDEMVAKEIINTPAFADENGFSKQKYSQALQQFGMKKSDYEESVRNHLAIDAVLGMFSGFVADEKLLNMVGELAFAQDKVAIKELAMPSVQPSDKDLKQYYEEHKDDYKSLPRYLVASYEISPSELSDEEVKSYWEEHKFAYKDENAKILEYEAAKPKAALDAALEASKRDAKLKYIELKKDPSKFSKRENVGEKDGLLSFLQDQAEGVVAQPFVRDGKWVIAMIEKSYASRPLSFEEAKEQLSADAAEFYAMQELEKSAKEQLDSFKPQEDLGWLNKAQNNTKLSNEAYSKLLTAVASGKNRGYVMLDNGALMYEITGKRLGSVDDTNGAPISKEQMEQLKQQLQAQAGMIIEQELLQQLATKYPAEIYYKGKEL